jgi:hypothetical protein
MSHCHVGEQQTRRSSRGLNQASGASGRDSWHRFARVGARDQIAHTRKLLEFEAGGLDSPLEELEEIRF